MAIAESARSEVWGRVVAGVSVVGTVLSVIAVLLLGVIFYGLASDFGGSPPPWWYWPAVLGFATAGILGLVLSSAAPRSAHLLRLLGWIPVMSVGLSGPAIMAAVVVVGACHVSLLLATWRWTRHLPGRILAGLAVSVLLALLTVPIARDLSCENVGDPPETCDAWYRSAVGWGLFEEDDRQLGGWVAVALLAGLLVAIPVPPRD